MGRVLGVDFEEENVPKAKKFMISTRDNSEYKWQDDPNVIGALEIPSEPVLNVRAAQYTSRPVAGKEELLDEALELWGEWKLKDEFVAAALAIPEEYCCCGLLMDPDETIRQIVPQLNKGWIHNVNERLKGDRAGFHLDAYLWTWHNATGKSETTILLLRFIEETVSERGSSSDDLTDSLDG